ncbi:Eukaryotic translation initiation factor 2D [Mactra antiquata]
MFKKPFRIKSQTSMKGSDRKKLRAEIIKSFPNISPDSVTDIIPNKEEVTTVKIYTHAGDNAFIYCVNKIPLLFEVDKQKILYPSVYLLWKYPDLVERFTTWQPVFKKLLDGADLMLPGVIVREQLTPNTFKHVQKRQVCSINILGNKSPVAVGETLISGEDFYDSGMKGKGIHPCHLYGDELWLFGDKSSPPVLEDEPLPDMYNTEIEDTANPVYNDNNVENNIGTTADNTETVGESQREEADNIVDDIKQIESLTVDDSVNDTGACGGDADEVTNIVDDSNNDTIEPVNDSSDTKMSVISPDEMDKLLEFCFLCSIKSSLKKSDLPISTGTFYKQHVMKYCPSDKILDVKKSSFKKLSKFLQKQSKTGIITVKELSKGVDSITEIDKSHLALRGLEVPEIVIENFSESSEPEYSPPIITEMLAVTSNVLTLFKTLGYTKGSYLKPSEVRQCVTEYVKQNNLQYEDCKSEVILDPILADLLLTKPEGDRSTLKWEDVFSRLIDKMTTVYEVQLSGQAPIIHKGNLEPIKIDVVQRASNKKATVIENLDVYGIDTKSFAHTVQVKVACSASVTPSQQKNKGPQVVVQGNQTGIVGDLLCKTYMIPKKYIKGLEKASKSKRR